VRDTTRDSGENEWVREEVRLTVVPDEGVAEALCGLLRSEGIDCFYRDTDVSAAGIFGGTSFGGWREILVADDDLERARALLPDRRCKRSFGRAPASA
jgi:hypothetical protein